jgi:hypothetical protein
MTKLNKPIRRELSLPKINRPIILTVDPDLKQITLREKGCHEDYSIGILELYCLLIRRGGQK